MEQALEIIEIDYHQPGSDFAESVEIKNVGGGSVAAVNLFRLFADGDLGAVEPPPGQEVLVKNRLKVLRAEQDWSQARVARLLEVSRQTINAIETGKYDPSLPLAFGLARLFGRPLEQIFDPDGGTHRGEGHGTVGEAVKSEVPAAWQVPPEQG